MIRQARVKINWQTIINCINIIVPIDVLKLCSDIQFLATKVWHQHIFLLSIICGHKSMMFTMIINNSKKAFYFYLKIMCNKYIIVLSFIRCIYSDKFGHNKKYVEFGCQKEVNIEHTLRTIKMIKKWMKTSKTCLLFGCEW